MMQDFLKKKEQVTNYDSIHEKLPLMNGTKEYQQIEGGGNKEITELEIERSESSSVHSEDDVEGVEIHKGNIGYIGGLAIAINSIIGPAMLDLPALYQKSGFIPTTSAILLVCFLMAMCCLNMANVVSKIPGNGTFMREVEYSESFRIFWGQKMFLFTQISFFLCMMCQSIASIVDTAQVVDEFLANTKGNTAAIKFDPFPSIITWDKSSCPPLEDAQCDPFDDDGDARLISVGYIVAMICFLPLGLLNLKENTAWQIFCLVVTVVVGIQFIIFFITVGIDFNAISWWGESWYTLYGVILFDFTLVTAIPAWLYEKSPDVSVSNVIITSSTMTSVLYIAMGSLGAMAVPNVSQNMLSPMMIGSYGLWIQLGASFFAYVIIGLGIPLFSVLMRLNLTGSGLCSAKVGNILSVYVPWTISWLFYNASAVENLLSWGGLLFTSVCAFLAPLLLALHTTMKFDEKGSIPVWGGFDLSRRCQIYAISILFVLSIVMIIMSIVGQYL